MLGLGSAVVLFAVGMWLLFDWWRYPSLPGVPRPARERFAGLTQLLTEAGLEGWTARNALVGSAVLALVSGAVAFQALEWLVPSVLAAGLAAWAPWLYATRRRDLRRARFQEGLADALAQARDSLRTGRSVQEALGALGTTGPVALRPHFARLEREVSRLGFERALLRSRERLADPVWDACVAAFLLAQHLGEAALSEALDRQVRAVRQEVEIHRAIRAQQVRTKTSAAITVSMLPILVVLLRVALPGADRFYATTGGELLLLAASASVLVGYRAMLRLGQVRGNERVRSAV